MTEPIINNNSDLQKVIDDISFVNTVLDFKWKFEFKQIAVMDTNNGLTTSGRTGWLLWVSFERPDTFTGETGRGRGRDEIIWSGASLSSVVKTCWLLFELVCRHEMMEGFRWRNARIFNPHNSVIDLAQVQVLHAARTNDKE